MKQDYDGLYQFLQGVKNLSNIVSDRKNNHYLYNYCYLAYMAMRLIECKRILKDTGSIYLHCDNTMGHYLKILMDIIFGEKNFRNEIVWAYKKLPNKAKHFQKNKDTIFFYSKTDNYNFRKLLGEPSKASLKTFKAAEKIGYNANIKKNMVTVFDWEKYNLAVKT